MGGNSGRGSTRRLALVHTVVCLALWPIPVFGLLHAEAGAVVAAVGCLAAVVLGVGAFQEGESMAEVGRVHLGALMVPLVLLTVTLFWRPNCAYGHGLGLFLVLVPPSVLFGVALAYAVTGLGVRGPRMTGILTVLAVAVGGVIWDLGFHPQLFTYSHVFGGVLGPIYDEELAIRPGLFAAKAQTLLWALALIGVGAMTRGGGRRASGVALSAAVGLVLSYAFAQPLGIAQTEAGLRRVLSERIDLGPVHLFVAPDTPLAERVRLADEALYRFETLSARLGVRPDVPVAVYLYPSPDAKAALIGSRTTSVVPVWLPTPQIHMLADEAERSLGHEMVHVLAREFGMAGVKASPAVGLVEGLAVALEPPDGLPDATALVVAGRDLPPEMGGLDDPAEVIRATMSPGGFWTARAGVAYSANGAFVAWLLDRYGAAPLREAYRSGRFQAAYGRSLGDLAADWSADLARRDVDPEAVAVARWLFSRPSLFEVRCPHHVPADIRLLRDADDAWDRGEVEEAGRGYRAAAALNPLRLGALVGDLRASLARGEGVPSVALARAEALADSLPEAGALIHLADVRRLLGRDAEATYRAASDSLMPVDAFGRLLVHRRASLDREALARWLGSTPGDVPREVREGAPILAALALAGDDRPGEAWEVARRWCVDSLLAGLDSLETAEGARVLRLVQGTMAYRAGALSASLRSLDGLDTAFADGGPRSLSALVRDRTARVRWRHGLVDPPAIFAAQPPAPDALISCSAVRRPAARDGLRAP